MPVSDLVRQKKYGSSHLTIAGPIRAYTDAELKQSYAIGMDRISGRIQFQYPYRRILG